MKCWVAYFKRRPSRRDDRWLLVLPKPPRDQEPNVPIVPSASGTDFFLHHFPALRTGLLFTKPLRDESSAHTTEPYVDAHGQLRTAAENDAEKIGPQDLQADHLSPQQLLENRSLTKLLFPRWLPSFARSSLRKLRQHPVPRGSDRLAGWPAQF